MFFITVVRSNTERTTVTFILQQAWTHTHTPTHQSVADRRRVEVAARTTRRRSDATETAACRKQSQTSKQICTVAPPPPPPYYAYVFSASVSSWQSRHWHSPCAASRCSRRDVGRLRSSAGEEEIDPPCSAVRWNEAHVSRGAAKQLQNKSSERSSVQYLAPLWFLYW